MERTYKNKKDYNKGITIDGMVVLVDDRHINYFSEGNMSEINCFKCKHFREWDYFCKAFPNGIPDELLDGIETHREVRSDQKGQTIFEPKKQKI